VGEKLETVKQGLQRAKPYFLGFLVVLVVAGAILALYYWPKMQVPVCPPDQTGLPPKVCFDIENEARKTLAYIMGGLLAIIGITLAHRRIRALERQVQIGQEQLRVAQEGQITERFTRAIEQLGSDKMAIRLGGIYALERIANDSDKDYWTIMETLTAFLRENFPWREISPEGTVDDTIEKALKQMAFTYRYKAPIRPATDLQAILTVLARRKYWHGNNENKPLDLTDTNLQGANLFRAHLEGALLDGAHLEDAILVRSYMNEALLREIHLERAHLDGTQLKSANLDGAIIIGGDLQEANLEGAYLRGARLDGAYLRGAHLEGADLTETCLEGTYLGGVTGLTRMQLARAIIDEKTILPEYLQEQPTKAKEPEGNDEE
jgi:uncharacterized protein YjbI with pentapeptide repeats